MPTRAEAIQTLTAPGGMFEIGDADVLGERLRVYTNAPASLRDVWASTAVHAANTFFVYAGERTTFGVPIGRKQGVAFQIADLEVMLSAARLLAYRAAWLKDSGAPVADLIRGVFTE